MWCTRWYLPLLLLPLPTAPPYFLLLFLLSLTLHAKPCFYCIVLLTTLFISSCYWQPFPLDTPLSTPWSENITTFAEALNASLCSNYTGSIPTVIRAVDRCWCDLSTGGFFVPFNVSNWERASVLRLKDELERKQQQADSAEILNTLNGTLSTSSLPESETSSVSPTTERFAFHLPHLSLSSIRGFVKRRHSSGASPSSTPSSTSSQHEDKPSSADTSTTSSRELDLRPYGINLRAVPMWMMMSTRREKQALKPEERESRLALHPEQPKNRLQAPPSLHQPPRWAQRLELLTMASDQRHRASKSSRSTSRTAQSNPGVESATPSTGLSKLELVQQAIFSPFNHKKTDSTRILSDLAPAIMTPRMMNSAATVSSRPRDSITNSRGSRSAMDFATIGRTPFRLGLGSRRITASDLQIVEATEELLQAEVPEPEGVAADVSLLRGFNATIPSSDQSRTRRRQMRNVDTPKLGLKKLGMSARGLLTEEEEHDGQSVASEDDLVVIPSQKKKRGRESLSATKRLGKEELTRQVSEIMRDKENLHVRRSLVNSEIAEITDKIRALDVARSKLEKDLLKLQEDELELEDELEGVKERMRYEESARSQKPDGQTLHLPPSSRRRKGPAFLPSEHDELPPGVAFMTLDSHTTPITALDFSEPYGTLVSASEEDAQPRVWDLLTGSEIGRLRGHIGAVKCLQIEDNVCLTGGEDGNVRLWDLRKVDEDDGWGSREPDRMPDVIEEEDETADDGELLEKPSGVRSRTNSTVSKDGPCARVLEGHSRAVTALYFEDDCLVTGASDKTLRQWDLTTGQCVMTMDILWAISHSSNPSASTSGFDPYSSFSMPNPAASNAWDTYDDFVGGVQFWGYGLVSGSGDGAVRMWDMRTGQAHRTLLGHTAPITCLQFDELHIATGSLDQTMRLWDLRTGGVVETMQFDHPVTSLQFDTRKIVAAAGENGVKIYNRTTGQQSTLLTNGHTRPVERLRYMDRYLVTGGRDAAVKIWSL